MKFLWHFVAEYIEARKLTRGALLAELGAADVSMQNVTRWTNGDIRSPWVPRLGRLIDAPPAVMMRELADRLDCPVPTANTLAAMASDDHHVARILAGFLNVDSTDDVQDWCRRATGRPAVAAA